MSDDGVRRAATLDHLNPVLPSQGVCDMSDPVAFFCEYQRLCPVADPEPGVQVAQ